MKKTLIISTFIISLLALSSFTIAKDLKWFEKETPIDKLTTEESNTLINNEQYIWKTNSYWKENNCYYYDLQIGNTTDISWSDARRELICTDKELNVNQIEKLQLENVEWTLKQLGKTSTTQITPTIKTELKKSENTKTKEKFDKTLKVN